MKSWLVGVVAAAVVGGGAAAGTGVYLNQPEIAARNAIVGAIEDFGERDEIKPLVNMTKEGSLEIEAAIDSEELGAELGFDSASIGGKFYYGENQFLIDDLHVKVGDIVNVSANLYSSDDRIYIENDEFLGGAWGFEKGKTSESFADSIFAPDSGSAYALPEEAYEIIDGMLKYYDECNVEDTRKDLGKFIEDYLKVAVKSISKNAEYESDNDKVDVGDDSVNARVITVSINEDTIVAVLEDIYAEMEKDKDLKKFVTEQAEALLEHIDLDMDIEADEIYDNLLDALDEAVDVAKDEIEDVDIELEIVTPKMSSKLMKLVVSSDGDEIFTLDLGKDGIKDSERIELIIGEEISVVYEIEEHSKKIYKSALEVEYDGTEVFAMDFEFDAKEEYFEISIDDLGVSLSGSYTVDGDVYTFICNEISAAGETIEDVFSIKIAIEEKADMPDILEPDEVNDIFDIEESDINKIIEDVVGKFEDLDNWF